MSKVRVAVIGSGMMGVEHLANLALFDEVAVVALVDPVPSSLQYASGKVAGAAHFTSVTDLLASGTKPDAVIIASPNHTHHDVLAPLFETDLHILCEKPLCSDLDDAKRVAERAAAHRGVFWVGMEYRFMPPAAEFIAQVHGGRVGRLVMLAMREHRFPFLPKVGDWNRFSRNTGGTMVEKCCHFFDLMRLIVRAEPVRVHCSGAMDVNHLDERYGGQRPDIIDNSYTVVDFDNGVRAMLDLCMFADGAEQQEELAATGDKARLEVFVPSGELIYSPRVGFRQPKQVERTLVGVDKRLLAVGAHHGATHYQHRAFLDAILKGAPVQVTADDGLRAVAMGTAAEISAREKRVVELSELGLG
ncbi:Gfo/Idh/MocA family protein [Niveispirillum sp. KHB5.9]|uniref:Gfo/Idh/MocA family protein n=1 Tax=Niveispirillum sp. KHB5.9 TaxID=3400269 RepID=UPI003A83511A